MRGRAAQLLLRRRLGRAAPDDHGAGAPAAGDEACGLELGVGAGDRPGGHAQVGGERAHGGQPGAVGEQAGSDVGRDLAADLLVRRRRAFTSTVMSSATASAGPARRRGVGRDAEGADDSDDEPAEQRRRTRRTAASTRRRGEHGAEPALSTPTRVHGVPAG